MQRRHFITLIGGVAVAPAMLWPLEATAQPDGRVRRVGMLVNQDNPGSQTNLAALREALAKLGWIEGRNLRIELRFTANDPGRIRAYAGELVSLAPDVIVTGNGPATRAVQQQTRTNPIVFMAGGGPRQQRRPSRNDPRAGGSTPAARDPSQQAERR